MELNVIYMHIVIPFGKELSSANGFAFSSATVESAATSKRKEMLV